MKLGVKNIPEELLNSSGWAWRRSSTVSPAAQSHRSRNARHLTLRLTLPILTAICALAPVLFPSRAAARQDQTDKARQIAAYRDGKKAIRTGKYQQAIDTYKALLDRDSRDVQALLGSAIAYCKLQNYRVCYEQVAEALKLDPSSARAHALAGLALLRSGYVPQSILELNEAFRLDAKEALAWGAAAEIDYYEGRSRESRDKAMHAFDLDSSEADYLMTYARASSRVEQFQDAADAYQRFLEIAPENDKERRARITGLVSFYRRLVGVTVHQLGGPRAANIPFRLGNDRRPYLQVLINGQVATFVVDTGSGFTVISKESAKRFGVSEIARGGTSQGVGGDGRFDIVYGLIRTLQLGEVKIRAIPCFIRPFHGTKDRPPDERADGFIGLSVLSYFLTEIDYQTAVMRLDRDPEAIQKVAASSPDSTVIPFRTTQNGLISVETELDGNHRINAILDSGASSTVISTAAVDRLNMRNSIIKGQTARVIGAAGVSENVELLFIRNCRVADLEQINMRALVLDFNAINETSGFEQSGILGGDFLRHYRVTINFNRAQVTLRPHTDVNTQ